MIGRQSDCIHGVNANELKSQPWDIKSTIRFWVAAQTGARRRGTQKMRRAQKMRQARPPRKDVKKRMTARRRQRHAIGRWPGIIEIFEIRKINGRYR